MLFLSIAQNYFLWHYTRAFQEIFHVWLNLLWFTVHFFSLPQLFKSWFAPFKRITEHRHKGDSLEDLAGYVIINIMSRLVGALMRSILMLLGFLCLTIIIIGGIMTYLLWLALPIIAVGLLVVGGTLLFI